MQYFHLNILLTSLVPRLCYYVEASAVGDHGRLNVDEFFQVKGYKDIFAVGDCTDVADPKLAYAAVTQAKHVFENLKNLLTGNVMTPYKAGKYCTSLPSMCIYVKASLMELISQNNNCACSK